MTENPTTLSGQTTAAALAGARHVLDELHMNANAQGAEDDMDTKFRRANHLWNALVQRHPTADGEPVPAWADLSTGERWFVSQLVATAVTDVLEVEQAMYGALSVVLDAQAAGVDVADRLRFSTEPAPTGSEGFNRVAIRAAGIAGIITDRLEGRA